MPKNRYKGDRSCQYPNQMNDYSFHLYNSLASSGIALSLRQTIPHMQIPVIVCIGSDLSVGDSLGPMVGTRLKEKLSLLDVYIYGTLTHPITAHEVKYCNNFIHQTHPDKPVLAVDAAVGNSGDIALIRVGSQGIHPGSGANKKLGKIGDASIIGIVAEKSALNYALFSSTRLNMVYQMAEIIAQGISDYIFSCLSSPTKKAI